MPYHRKTKEQFVKEAVQVHGDKYDYTEVKYVLFKIRQNVSMILVFPLIMYNFLKGMCTTK